MKKGKDSFYAKYVKRILDIICALLAMIVFCWLYAIIALLVRIKLGSPVLFVQERPGIIDKNTGKEKAFNLIKFRTMTNERDEDGIMLQDELRLTKFGRLLRSTSLDELPEAWNILRGDMSVIGPRPLVFSYIPFYTKNERRRHEVKPGLSGYAQVSGRNSLSWNEKFKFDVKYVDNISLLLDIKIIIKTVVVALKREDIGQGKDIPISFSEYRKNQWEEREKKQL